MKKNLIAFVALAALAGGAYTAAAAPVTYVPAMGGNAGYSYNNAADGVHDLYLEFSPINRVVVGAEYQDWINGGHSTDVYAKYRLSDRFYVGVGNRDYSEGGSKVFGMVEGMTNVADRLDAYAGVKLSSDEKEYRVGALYDLMPAIDIDVNYTYHDLDDYGNEDGIGVGVNYRF